MSLLRSTWLVSVGTLLTAGACTLGSTSDPGTTAPPTADAGAGDPVVTPPTGDPTTPTPTKYIRSSMKPTYKLLPRSEYPRLTEQGVTFADSDFAASGTGFVTAAQKMDDTAATIARDQGLPSLDLLDDGKGVVNGEDRQRAQTIPFRGHPSDVKLLSINGQRFAYVPLGGDVMKPGNEVAVVDVANAKLFSRVKVGVRPQRVAIHPAGLVFVCNELSNYISIIDANNNNVLLVGQDGKPVEIKTDYYCSDMQILPQSLQGADNDKQDLYVANSWHGSVMKYSTTIVRDGLNNITGITVAPSVSGDTAEAAPTDEIKGVGHNPFRITVGQDQASLFVANFRGGQLARIDLGGNAVHTIGITGPVPQIIQVNDQVIGITTSIDRGLPAAGDQVPTQIQVGPYSVAGLDGQQHVVNPGLTFDHTSAYNFEDLRNGAFTVNAQLTSGSDMQYFTDDISPERHFLAAQKVLAGSMPQAIVLNKARTRAFLAMSGSDNIQVLSVAAGGQFRLAKAAGSTLFTTAARPFELALDETNNQLLAANWGGDSLQIFSSDANGVGNATPVATINLGYANVKYPATNIERGEYLFYNTSWSNNGRKSCGQCHWQELLLDGIPYANGTQSPAGQHKVPSNMNLLTTDSYFWNGCFNNGSYASLASDAQSRTNCELIAFGEVEGMDSDPTTRVGDPGNKVRSANNDDLRCRPVIGNTILPTNFKTDIAPVIAADKLIRNTLVQQETQASQIGIALQFQDVSRFVDFYSVSEHRVPANPLAFVQANGALDSATKDKITAGQTVFMKAGCGGCHDPNNTRHPFTDGANHGSGTQWTNNFIATYGRDQRLLSVLPGGIPSGMLNANLPTAPGKEVNVHVPRLDFFTPFCFTLDHCLQFDDPLTAGRNSAAESDRLDALIQVNLANADRGFVPGNLPGSPVSNTPSLRGIWYQTNYMRHGLAHSLREAVLAPGHPALHAGETGYAVSAGGDFNVHGVTKDLTADDVDNLFYYLSTIE